MRKKDFTRIAATPQAEDAWTEHDSSLTVGLLFTEGNSWFMGTNIPGKKRHYLLYAGGSPKYRQKCEEVAAKGYEGFLLQ
jgi:cyclohexanone monooxygenase